MNSRIANAVTFQVGWWIAVLGGGAGHPWSGTILVLGSVVVNVWLSSDHCGTARTIFLVGLFGTLLDSALSSAGILLFAVNPLTRWLCPPWLIALWCLLATTLNRSFRWLAGRDWLAALVGGFFGPLSYAAGQSMGALSLGPSVGEAVLVLVVLWAITLPLLVRLA